MRGTAPATDWGSALGFFSSRLVGMAQGLINHPNAHLPFCHTHRATGHPSLLPRHLIFPDWPSVIFRVASSTTALMGQSPVSTLALQPEFLLVLGPHSASLQRLQVEESAVFRGRLRRKGGGRVISAGATGHRHVHRAGSACDTSAPPTEPGLRL